MKCFGLAVGFISSTLACSAMAINLNKGQGALLYDASYATGPDSKITNDPGQWSSNIQAFNAGASSGHTMTRLYPYAGDIEMNCTGPSDCVFSGAGQNVYVYYNSPAFGRDSVAAYRNDFPNATILAIIDGSTTSSLLAPLSYSELGVKTADLVAQTICPDENVDGIFFDLEPINITSPGQFAFYKEISKQFASSTCIDAKHPKGRIFAVFAAPGKITSWGQMAAALGTNGYIAVSGYDVRDTCPPTPVSIQAYTNSITGVAELMDSASTTNKIPYTMVGPAAASFGEFQQYGVYDASNPPSNFKLIKDYGPEGITQLGYIQALRGIITSTCKSPYYLGQDNWSWSEYKSPCTKSDENMLLPNIPEGTVVTYLQKNG